MTKNQYRAALAKLNLSQHKAAEFFGISPRASQGYAIGEQPVPKVIGMLLRLMIKLGLTTEDVK